MNEPIAALSAAHRGATRASPMAPLSALPDPRADATAEAGSAEVTDTFDLELVDSVTLDGRTLELTYRPTLHG